jgi:hypothetical protein
MALEGSLPHLQQPVTCSHPEPDQSTPCPHHTVWKSVLILPFHLRLGLPSGLFPSGIPIKTLYTSLLCVLRATCSAHLILLDLIIRTIFGEEYRSLSSSFRSFLHSLVHNFLSTLISKTLSLLSSLNITDQDLHPYKKRYNYICVCLNLYIFGR